MIEPNQQSSYAGAQLGSAGCGYPSASKQTEAVQATMFERVNDRLMQLQAILGDSYDSLSTLSNRVFGAQPELPVGSAGAKPPHPHALSDALLETLDVLINASSQLQSKARILNQRI